MSKLWKFGLALVLVSPLVLAGSQSDLGSQGSERAVESSAELLADAHDLVDVQVSSDAEGRPMVTLASSGPVEYETLVLDGPDRLVVDLLGVVSRMDRYRINVNHDGVAGIRAAQHRVTPTPVTRVVFDLERPLAYRVVPSGDTLVVVFGDDGGYVSEAGGLEETAEPEIAQVVIEIPAATPPLPSPEKTTTEKIEIETVDQILAEMAARTPGDYDIEPPSVTDEAPSATAAAPQAMPVEAEPELSRVAINVPTFETNAPSEFDLPTTTETEAPAPAEAPAPTEVEISTNRAMSEDAMEHLLNAPAFAAPQDRSARSGSMFRSTTIVTDAPVFTGKRISINLVDADLKQVFRFFHEISGLNFVLDPEVQGSVTIVLDQVPWDQALDLILKNNGLDKVLENNVLRIATTQKLAQEAASRKQLKEAEELEVEPITITRTLSYAKARDAERVIRDGGILSPRGKVIVDERTNTLIISDIPKKAGPLDSLITVLDAETPQVMIEARIVETTQTFAKDLGVTWGFLARADAGVGTATNLTFPHNASAGYQLNLPGQAASTLAFSFGNVVDSFTLDVALQALESEGQGRILSSPRIATQNNERAEIEQGVRIPIVNTTATEINVEYVSASLLLTVTPQITAEGTIILDVIVENNSPDFVNTAADIPSIRTQRAQTKVLITDGGTTVIGGIFVVNEGQSEIGVPWFRKIPVFGWLFRSQNITKENRELLIFITPKIVKLG